LPPVAGAHQHGDGAIAADLIWRAADEKDWRRVSMQLDVNDRWHAAFAPGRVGRPRLLARHVLESEAGTMARWGVRRGVRLEVEPAAGPAEARGR